MQRHGHPRQPRGSGQQAGEGSPAKAGSALAALAALAILLLVAACSSGSPAAGTAGHALGTQGGARGTQHGQGGGLTGTPSHHQSKIYSGTFSVAFARCMRGHGIQGFPDPDGKPDQLASSGIDIHSATFQAALYGACKSLAPHNWLSNPLGPPPTGPGS